MGVQVLIVAAEAQVRRSLTRICGLVDVQSGLADTPADALIELARAHIDVCLLSFSAGQPLSEKLSLLREMRAQAPLLELVVLNGSDLGQLQASLSELDLYAILPEPWPEDHIVATIIQGAIRYGQLRGRHEALRGLWHAGLRHLGACMQALGGLSATHEILAALVRSLASIDRIGAAGAILSHGADSASPPELVLGSQTELSGVEASALIQSLATAVGYVGAGPKPRIVHLPPEAPRYPVQSPGDDGEREACRTGTLGLPDGASVVLMVTVRQHDICDDLQPLLDAFGALAQSAFERQAALATARDRAMRDSLTGLYDLAHFMELAAQAIERAMHDGTELAVMMLDVDSEHGLKQVNDRFGHQAGDRLLRDMADLLRSHVRPGDILARYGGDEFLILAPNTARAEGLALAESLMKAIGAAEFAIEPHVRTHISVSVGLAVISEPGGPPADLLAKADRALYLAKARGGSCIGVFD